MSTNTCECCGYETTLESVPYTTRHSNDRVHRELCRVCSSTSAGFRDSNPNSDTDLMRMIAWCTNAILAEVAGGLKE